MRLTALCPSALAKPVVFLGLYIAVMGGGVWGLAKARRWAIDTQSTQANQLAWDQWRMDAKRQARGTGPVLRRPPKSELPPSLVLLRDHFATCLAAWLVLGSVLFGTMSMMLIGAANSRQVPHQDRGAAASSHLGDYSDTPAKLE